MNMIDIARRRKACIDARPAGLDENSRETLIELLRQADSEADEKAPPEIRESFGAVL